MLKKYSSTKKGKESVKQSHKKFLAKNPNYNKEYYLKNKDKFKDWNKKWREANKEELKEYQREYREAHKEKELSYHLKRRYGITFEEYSLILSEQNGVCAICFENRKLVVDHCHSTGEVRGLLCTSCNFGIGNLKDSVLLLESAKQYLCKK